MAHPVAERALAHFNALFPSEEATLDSEVRADRLNVSTSEAEIRPRRYLRIDERVSKEDEQRQPMKIDLVNPIAASRREVSVAHTRPTLVSLFAGAGGLDIGLEYAGFRSVLATDINHDACETLRANRTLFDLELPEFEEWAATSVLSQRCHATLSNSQRDQFVRRVRETIGNRGIRGPERVIEGDIRQIRAEDILSETGLKKGEIDLLAGGPPCQPFSRAGKREMMRSSDGLLFLEFIRLIDDLQPRFFVFENVKGMVIQKSPVKLVKCGACGHTSLPAFESIYLLDDGDPSRIECPECYSDNGLVSVMNVRGGALRIVEGEFRRTGYKIYSAVLNAADYGAPQSRERIIIVGSRDSEDFQFPAQTHSAKCGPDSQRSLFGDGLRPWVTMADTIFAQPHWKYGALSSDKARLWVKNVVRPHDEPVTWTLDRIAPTVGAHQSAKLAIAPNGVPEAQLQRQQWHVRGKRQGDTPPVPVEHEYLSDEELLVLQTFPADWYLHGTRMERAFQIGNAVPPALAEAVGGEILKAMTGSNEKSLPLAINW